VLESFNYKPKNNCDRRRKVLKTAIQTHSFDVIYTELKALKNQVEGYKEDRIEYDIRWLKKNSHKYYSQVLDSKDREQNKVAN